MQSVLIGLSSFALALFLWLVVRWIMRLVTRQTQERQGLIKAMQELATAMQAVEHVAETLRIDMHDSKDTVRDAIAVVLPASVNGLRQTICATGDSIEGAKQAFALVPKTTEALTESVGKALEAATAAKEALESIPKLQEGLIRVCEAQVNGLDRIDKQLEKMTEAIAYFNRGMFGAGGSGENTFTPWEPGEASLEAEIQDLIRQHGMSREEAEGRAKSQQLYQRMRMTR